MIINHKKKWIYIGPPKTASTAISYVLTDGKYNPHQMEEILNPNFRGIEVSGQHTPWPPNKLKAEYKKYNVFISVRNPFSRIVSLFNHWKYGENYAEEPFSKNKTFEDFMILVIEKKLSNDGFFHTTITDWVHRYDSFIKQENLKNDLKSLNIHSHNFFIPKINDQNNLTKNWKKQHSKKTIEITIEWAKEDFKNFNYSKDINA